MTRPLALAKPTGSHTEYCEKPAAGVDLRWRVFPFLQRKPVKNRALCLYRTIRVACAQGLSKITKRTSTRINLN